MTCSALSGGVAQVQSSVVCASETNVALKPRAIAPCSVDRMQASVCAPHTISCSIASSCSNSSKFVPSNESPNCLWTTGSSSSMCNSSTYAQPSLPFTSSSSECCTQMTGTSALRALSTKCSIFATTSLRRKALATTSR